MGKKPWIFITEWITVLGTLIACFVFLHNQIQSISNKLDSHIAYSSQRIDQANQRIDQMNLQIAEEKVLMNQTNQRIDQMYQVLLEALREGRKL